MSVKQVINDMLTDIWAKYDEDSSGFLDRDETRQFVQELQAGLEAEGLEVEMLDFDECFDDFDKNGDGKLSKKEMRVFLQQLLQMLAEAEP
ncbi:Aste57867_23113 [Aphanomyces stellatus]|uniref:Aste57867_14066 protein n=1 Tax=Aphanomyces stellatus TaxID=120398 RepID=A0A485L0E6_9STRA|nr:hypothetical protein As57867_023041 [Aphanomyces stellatus]KAF0684956.1 hypothetical protein As57867_023042 [Aphanomyces stellatus]KAF0695095.1 hypothetical protein As57867_014015 [Aphanomyces stellatus]VFT90894.1 Aste57867_14066 [Aphanomyces stellatus]VFT99760.1 Aste57867_23112 [Aphanomyces stellatus]